MILNFDEAFKILEIEPTDDKKKIKIAYSKMLKKYHPEDFPEMFMKINEAYRVALEFEKADFDEVKSENKMTEKNNENEEFFERVKKNFEENKEWLLSKLKIDVKKMKVNLRIFFLIKIIM